MVSNFYIVISINMNILYVNNATNENLDVDFISHQFSRLILIQISSV